MSRSRTIPVSDAVVIVIGIVVGAGIFKTPAMVAARAGSEAELLLAWVVGGAVSLVGGLCYAELASAYPDAGGDYHYLVRAYGQGPGFLFAWARLAVIQSGSIAMLAFIVGDYATQVVPLGHYSSALYAAATVSALTAANAAGIGAASLLQRGFTLSIGLGLALVAGAGLWASAGPAAVSRISTGQGLGGTMSGPSGFGSAMVFVLLTYGGWNEASYLSAELENPSRNMVRVLLVSIGLIAGAYLLVNLAMVRSLGLAGMSGSVAVAADLMRASLGEGRGEAGARIISILVALAAISTMNGTILTGARSGYALGRDFILMSFLGRWRKNDRAPINSLLVQAGVSLALVTFGAASRDGFSAMVEYTAPVFWFFFLLTGVSLFILRRREPELRRPFLTPAYPIPPALFCAACLYMLQSSIAYTGRGALVGLAVLAVGLPLLACEKVVRRTRGAHTGAVRGTSLPGKEEDQP